MTRAVSKKIHTDEDTAELRAIIGPRLRQARSVLDITQEVAAEKIGISSEFYARLERGNALPSVQTLAKMGTSLNVSVDHLLGVAEAPTTPQAAKPHSSTPKLPRQIAYVVERAREDADLSRLLIAAIKLSESRTNQTSDD